MSEVQEISSPDSLTPPKKPKRKKRTDRPMLLYLNETDHKILSHGAKFYNCSKHDVVRKFLHSFQAQLKAKQGRGDNGQLS